MTKYPPLYGICKTALENNLCNRLFQVGNV